MQDIFGEVKILNYTYLLAFCRLLKADTTPLHISNKEQSFLLASYFGSS